MPEKTPKYKRRKETLWSLGGAVLALIVMPVAIAQYPEFFNANRWLLPLSVVAVALCFIVPLVIHENAKRILRWAWSHGRVSKAVTVISISALVAATFFGGRKLLRFHIAHLTAVLQSQGVHLSPTVPPQLTPAVSPDPLVRLEPEHGTVHAQIGQEGVFLLMLENDGVDIDHLDCHEDFFLAEKNGNTIRINRLVNFEGVFSPDTPPLRTNQSYPIRVNFNLGANSIIQGVLKYGYRGIIGVRVRIQFRRYSDEKDFHLAKGYEALSDGSGNFGMLVAPDADHIEYPPFGDLVRSNELLPYMNSDDRWREPILKVTSDGKIEMVDKTAPPLSPARK